MSAMLSCKLAGVAHVRTTQNTFPPKKHNFFMKLLVDLDRMPAFQSQVLADRIWRHSSGCQNWIDCVIQHQCRTDTNIATS